MKRLSKSEIKAQGHDEAKCIFMLRDTYRPI